MRGTYIKLSHNKVFQDNLGGKINLSNEMGLSSEFVT